MNDFIASDRDLIGWLIVALALTTLMLHRDTQKQDEDAED